MDSFVALKINTDYRVKTSQAAAVAASQNKNSIFFSISTFCCQVYMFFSFNSNKNDNSNEKNLKNKVLFFGQLYMYSDRVY